MTRAWLWWSAGLIASAAVGVASAQAVPYPGVLPTEAIVRQALEQSPPIAIAREQLGLAESERKRLRAGEHEWSVAFSGQRRTASSGATYDEELYELSHGVRWPGKASLDRALGAQAVEVSHYAFEDAWHEAGRSLLAGWFNLMRASETVRQLEAQTLLLNEQIRTVQSRVKAGDAPHVELALAQTELDKASAAQIEATLVANRTSIELRRQFPALEPSPPLILDAPLRVSGSDESWVERILDHNHELELADALHEQSRLAARRVGRERVPDPTIALRYSDNFDGNDRVVGVGVTLPIGGTRRRAEHAIALSDASIAGQRAREARLRVSSDAQQAILTARATHTQWQRMEAIAAQSAKNAEIVARGYGLGEFTIAELLSARRQSQEAALAAALARLNALEAGARLRLDAHEIWVAPEHEE